MRAEEIIGRMGSRQGYNSPIVRCRVGFMADYRCYLVSGDRFQAVQNLECASDAEVILKATALLHSKPQHQAVEIWQGSRLVSRVPRREPLDDAQKIVPIGGKRARD
jgi:hypothetical protein